MIHIMLVDTLKLQQIMCTYSLAVNTTTHLDREREKEQLYVINNKKEERGLHMEWMCLLLLS